MYYFFQHILSNLTVISGHRFFCEINEFIRPRQKNNYKCKLFIILKIIPL